MKVVTLSEAISLTIQEIKLVFLVSRSGRVLEQLRTVRQTSKI